MPIPSTTITYLTKPQTRALLASLDTVRNRAIWTVAYWRGLRASEVGLLSLSDWRPESSRLFVHRLKGSNSGEYKVSPEEDRALRAWVKVRGEAPGPLFPSSRGIPISRQRLHNLMVGFCAKAKIPHPVNHFHVLRHSIAVHLAEAGTDVSLIQDWLGHRSITNTMVYVQITNHNRDRNAEAMYAYTEAEGAGEGVGEGGEGGGRRAKPRPKEKASGPRPNWKADKLR